MIRRIGLRVGHARFVGVRTNQCAPKWSGQGRSSFPQITCAPVSRNFSTVQPAHERTFYGSVPTIEDAKEQPRTCAEMPHDVLLALAASGNAAAREERMIREVMAVDNIEWANASEKVEEMRSANVEIGKTAHAAAAMYYKTAAISSLAIGFASFPLCFDLSSVAWFNSFAVTADVPPPEDLETAFEVGMWAWGWMEPPLGQLSFFLLCIQFAREQMDKLQLPTAHSKMMSKRANQLAEMYSTYYAPIVEEFSEAQPF